MSEKPTYSDLIRLMEMVSESYETNIIADRYFIYEGLQYKYQPINDKLFIFTNYGYIEIDKDEFKIKLKL